MFVSPAFAQGASAAAEPNLLTSMIPLVLIFVVFYFLLIRPQQKKMKEHRAMLEAVRRGDRVVTNGGIIGLVTKVMEAERELQIEIAEGVRVRVMRDMIAQVLSKTEPVAANDSDKKDPEKKDAGAP
ncbi:MAG: preprotein translocase subunit YajC [Rhodospirillaceae bacterium]|nr:preprotein translocase subunit YajC [Rhodospirillaceae bacterium]